MRVLHILEATGGGTRRHVLDLLPALQQRGVANSLMYSPLRNRRFCDDLPALHALNIPTHPVAMGHSTQCAGDARALSEVRAHLKSHRYDVIHCHSSNAALLGRIANAMQTTPAPLVYTPHYIALAAALPPAQRRAARWLEKWLAPKTNHFIAVSQHELSVLQRSRLLRDNNATVIPNGVAAAHFSPPSHRASADAKTNAIVIGCFGRLTRQKNQQLLLRALPLVARELPGVRLCLVGDGEDAPQLRALAVRLDIEQHLEWRGELRDAACEYARCDIIAQPSRWEGCSYALLEAMASSRAIVASTCGGNPEVVGDSGILLPAHDVRSWAREIVALARDENRRYEMGRAARERVAAHFRLETMLEKTLQVYQRVLL